MIDLEKISGLPLELTDDNHLKFGAPLQPVEPSIRKFTDMQPVYVDPEAKPKIDEMYYMYRNIHLPEHERILTKNNIRYDITVVPASLIGNEFNKTFGHYHPVNDRGLAYPEVYEVLAGRALFLIQKMDKNPQNIITVIATEASPGEKVIYPPGYGHIIVNIGEETLVTANWVADNFESDYASIKDLHGMAYYVVSEGLGAYSFQPNPHYASPPPVRVIKKDFMKSFKIAGDKPMYITAVIDPKSLEFLNYPETAAVELSSITS